MSSSIRAVIFDQGGVLSDGGGRGTNEAAASRAMGLDFTIEVPELLEALKRGEIDNAQFVNGINQLFPDAPVRLTDAMWDDVYVTLTKNPLAYDFVDTCRASGRLVGLLSNINPAIAERLREDGSYDGFDLVILSCYVKCAKPDPEIYAIVEEHLAGFAPEEILLLDDQDKCIDGALARGWQGIKVTSAEQMVRDAGALLGMYGWQ